MGKKKTRDRRPTPNRPKSRISVFCSVPRSWKPNNISVTRFSCSVTRLTEQPKTQSHSAQTTSKEQPNIYSFGPLSILMSLVLPLLTLAATKDRAHVWPQRRRPSPCADLPALPRLRSLRCLLRCSLPPLSALHLSAPSLRLHRPLVRAAAGWSIQDLGTTNKSSSNLYAQRSPCNHVQMCKCALLCTRN